MPSASRASGARWQTSSNGLPSADSPPRRHPAGSLRDDRLGEFGNFTGSRREPSASRKSASVCAASHASVSGAGAASFPGAPRAGVPATAIRRPRAPFQRAGIAVADDRDAAVCRGAQDVGGRPRAHAQPPPRIFPGERVHEGGLAPRAHDGHDPVPARGRAPAVQRAPYGFPPSASRNCPSRNSASARAAGRGGRPCAERGRAAARARPPRAGRRAAAPNRSKSAAARRERMEIPRPWDTARLIASGSSISAATFSRSGETPISSRNRSNSRRVPDPASRWMNFSRSSSERGKPSRGSAW